LSASTSLPQAELQTKNQNQEL